MNTRQREESLTLEILEAIEQRDNVTQRHLADRMGVALGLANSYLKRCVRKGLIKIHQAPANRYLYYLTQKGFAEKSRLTAEYLSYSFNFYRKAGDSYRTVFEQTQNNGWSRVLFCGISELAEIASLRINEFDLKHVATYESGSNLKEFLGKPVLNDLAQADKVDAYIMTSFALPKNIYDELVEKIDRERVLFPDILGLNV